jgi:hypothetical protein
VSLQPEVEIPEESWAVIGLDLLFEALKRVERGHTAESVFADLLQAVQDEEDEADQLIFGPDEDDDEYPLGL